MCDHCKNMGPEPGWIETDNNGPIVACPVCNPNGEIEQAREKAEAQRDRQLNTIRRLNTIRAHPRLFRSRGH